VSVSAPRTYSSLSAADLETIRAVASPRQLMDMFGVSDTTAYKWKTRATGSASPSPSPSNGRPAKPEDNNNNSNKSVGEGEAVAVVGQS
jgi:transposase